MSAYPCPHCGSVVHRTSGPTLEGIVIGAVSTVIGIDAALVRAPDRSRHTSHARHIAMYILRNDYHRSYPEIGRAFGHADHTSAMHACRKIADQAQRFAELRGVLAVIRATIAEQRAA